MMKVRVRRSAHEEREKRRSRRRAARRAHEDSLRHEGIDTLAGTIDRLERLHAEVTSQDRSPANEQMFVSKCLQEIEFAFAKARAREGEPALGIPRFTRMLIDAFGQLRRHSRPALFALPGELDIRNKSVLGDKDRCRNAAVASAAAIVDAIHRCEGTLGRIGKRSILENLAIKLFEAGLTNGDKPYTWTAINRWPTGEQVRRAPGAAIYQAQRKRLLSIEESLADPAVFVERLKGQEIDDLAAAARPFLGRRGERANGEKLEPSMAALCRLMFGSVLTPDQLAELADGP
jgi:hypothetical protein